MTQYESEEYITIEEAAALLGVSRRTVERYIKSRGIQRYRRGLKQILYRRSDIEKLLEPQPYDGEPKDEE